MIALRKIVLWREAPCAAGLIHQRIANQRSVIIDIHADHATGEAFRSNGTRVSRTRVIGAAAVGDNAGDRRHIVRQADAAACEYAGIRRGGVKGELPASVVAAGLRAFVACLIHRCGGQGVIPFRQIGFRRKAPVAILIHRRAADQFAIIIDIDVIDITGRFAREGRARIISDAAVRDRAGHRSDIVSQAQRAVNDAGGVVIGCYAVNGK